MSTAPRAGMAFIAACCAVVVAFLAVDAHRVDFGQLVVESLLLLALSLFAHGWRGNVDDSSAFSVGFIVTLASIPILGVWGAALVAALAGLSTARGAPIFVTAFNCAINGLSCLAAGSVYVALGGALTLAAVRDHAYATLVVLPLLLASMVMLAVQSVMLAVVQRLFDGTSIRSMLVAAVPPLVVPYLGYGLFGLLLAVLWDGADIGPLAAVLVLAPLYISRWAWAQNEDFERANERAVTALVRAVEAKDLYTRGHSERVARASVMIAGPVGLGAQRTRMLEFAGTLHDVGKIAVPTTTLQKAGRLTDHEFEQVALHPVHGFEMVRDIDALSEAVGGIMHHHERLDGRGYPLGLVGDDIPEFARIIAVADAFDAMTSTRSYRGARPVADAVAELRRCAGEQFEPRFVEALVEALETQEWEPVVAPAGAPSATPGVAHYDHDDPTAPPLPARTRPGRGRGR